MRKSTKTFLLASIFVASTFAASSLYAQDNQKPSGSMTSPGMMGDKNTKDNGEMMGMMKQMSEMMDHCSKMMSKAEKGKRPHKHRRSTSVEPEQKG